METFSRREKTNFFLKMPTFLCFIILCYIIASKVHIYNSIKNFPYDC